MSHGVRRQWQRAGTVQPLCSQTPRLPLGCAAAGPELAGSERPIRAGPAQGSLGARLQGLPAPQGAVGMCCRARGQSIGLDVAGINVSCR